ncbi:MAG: DUF4202 domain-containing protein [Acidobacteria bacterium]|nr:DUF4202 domain-containing protein [Acidobacteriota bacterium]
MDKEEIQAAFDAFDTANQLDPNLEIDGGVACPREYLYAKRLTEWIRKLEKEPSEELLLAARCQHIERWKIPRTQFPPGRKGYLEWRETLARFHARRMREILGTLNYPQDVIQRIESLNLKRNIKSDPQTQTMEDALCLVFLQYQFHEFVAKTGENDVLRIVRKTWKKMSPNAQKHALALDFHPNDRELITRALSTL